MKTVLFTVTAFTALVSVGTAQQVAFDRLPSSTLDVVAPSERVTGAQGEMRVRLTSCRAEAPGAIRRRIVDLAAQEWGFFGFTVVDETVTSPPTTGSSPRRRGRRGLSTADSNRVASSIGGYWTATASASWILDEQNKAWNDGNGRSTRWRYPWSAAFISWVMCEAGLEDTGQFRRAIAHHSYVDQAIRARSTDTPSSAFVAYDVGQEPIGPGDLLCSGSRPAYRSLAQREQQLGEGARMHCDIVVNVDADRGRLAAIGGNVRSSVALKLLPASREPGGHLRPTPSSRGRGMFVHLKLRAESIAPEALTDSPTVSAVHCADGFSVPMPLAATGLIGSPPAAGQC